MAQYIDKDALIAEIERRRDAALMRQQNLESIGQESVINEIVANELNRIITFINTLEVKEVQEPTASDRGMAEAWQRKSLST
jgi:predicted nucleic acid-binding protein